MNLEEIMKQKRFAILGNTTDPDKFAYKIKHGMLDKGYTVYPVGKEISSINDIDDEIDIIDLCIHPAKGLELLKECEKTFKCIVLQPGSSDEALLEYLDNNHIPYINGCLLIGLEMYS